VLQKEPSRHLHTAFTFEGQIPHRGLSTEMQVSRNTVMDELVVVDGENRYVGHVWGGLSRPLMPSQSSLRWCFAREGQIVAEFPATVLDTPETVRSRLLSTLARIQRNHANR